MSAPHETFLINPNPNNPFEFYVLPMIYMLYAFLLFIFFLLSGPRIVHFAPEMKIPQSRNQFARPLNVCKPAS